MIPGSTVITREKGAHLGMPGFGTLLLRKTIYGEASREKTRLTNTGDHRGIYQLRRHHIHPRGTTPLHTNNFPASEHPLLLVSTFIPSPMPNTGAIYMNPQCIPKAKKQLEAGSYQNVSAKRNYWESREFGDSTKVQSRTSKIQPQKHSCCAPKSSTK